MLSGRNAEERGAVETAEREVFDCDGVILKIGHVDPEEEAALDLHSLRFGLASVSLADRFVVGCAIGIGRSSIQLTFINNTPGDLGAYKYQQFRVNMGSERLGSVAPGDADELIDEILGAGPLECLRQMPAIVQTSDSREGNLRFMLFSIRVFSERSFQVPTILFLKVAFRTT